MDYVLTLIGALNDEDCAQLQKQLDGDRMECLVKNQAYDIFLHQKIEPALIKKTLEDNLKKPPLGDSSPSGDSSPLVDFIIQPRHNRVKKLIACDMDSTLILEETLDLLAEKKGCQSQIADITAQAMNGKIDFKNAIRKRVALLKGLEENVFTEILSDIHIRAGAQQLAQTMKAQGGHCLLLSGGFEDFVNPIAQKAGFVAAPSNRFEIKNGVLTGALIPPIYGAADKALFMREFAKKHHIAQSDIIAIGDGANDIDMIEAASIGICLGEKAILADKADMVLRGKTPNLEALLWIQGLV